jgi:hypothetical protein
MRGGPAPACAAGSHMSGTSSGKPVAANRRAIGYSAAPCALTRCG